METAEFPMIVCDLCGKNVPTTNIDLHYAHCSRYQERCTLCGDVVPKQHAEEHHSRLHSVNGAGLDREGASRGRATYKNLLWTVSMTGIAIVMGIFFTKKN